MSLLGGGDNKRPAKNLPAKKRRRGRRISFDPFSYALPAVDKRRMGGTPNYRDVLFLRQLPEDDMRRRSCLLRDLDGYERYCAVRLHRLRSVQEAVARFEARMASAVFRELPKTYPDDVRAAAAVEYATNEEWGGDSVFTDLFRLFFARESSAFFLDYVSDSRAVVRELYRSPLFSFLREITAGNPVLSALAAVNVMDSEGGGGGGGQGVAEQMGRAAAKGFSSESEEEQQDQDGDGCGEGDSQGEDGQPRGSEERCGSNSPEPSPQSQQVMRAAADEMKDAPDTSLSSYAKMAGKNYAEPLTDPSQLDFVERLLEMLLASDKYVPETMGKLFDVLGRMEESFTEALTTARVGDGDVVDVGRGGDVESMLGSEYAYFSADDDVLWTLFAKRFSESDLAVQQRTGLDDSGAGPVIVFLDTSGSMGDVIQVQGARFKQVVIAGSIAMALIRHCREARRRLVVCPFNYGVVTGRISEFDFAQEAYSPADILEKLTTCLAVKPEGGTSFEAAIVQVAEVMRQDIQMNRKYERADVIFFSDGYNSHGSALKEAKRNLPRGARLFGFFVCSGDTVGVERSNQFLFDYCKTVTPDGIGAGLAAFYAEVLKRSIYERSARG